MEKFCVILFWENRTIFCSSFFRSGNCLMPYIFSSFLESGSRFQSNVSGMYIPFSLICGCWCLVDCLPNDLMRIYYLKFFFVWDKAPMVKFSSLCNSTRTNLVKLNTFLHSKHSFIRSSGVGDLVVTLSILLLIFCSISIVHDISTFCLLKVESCA